MLPNDKYYQSLPKKRMASGVLFLNTLDQILLVKPSYKNHWEIPGGNVDENESPRAAAIREVKEELDMEINNLKFICVDYVPTFDIKNESLQFIFYGGILDEESVLKIRLQKEELLEYKFVSLNEAKDIVKNENLKTAFPQRLEQSFNAIKKGFSIYTESGIYEK